MSGWIRAAVILGVVILAGVATRLDLAHRKTHENRIFGNRADDREAESAAVAAVLIGRMRNVETILWSIEATLFGILIALLWK